IIVELRAKDVKDREDEETPRDIVLEGVRGLGERRGRHRTAQEHDPYEEEHNRYEPKPLHNDSLHRHMVKEATVARGTPSPVRVCGLLSVAVDGDISGTGEEKAH